MVERFMDLFTGSSAAYGLWGAKRRSPEDPTKFEPASTVKRQVTQREYERHLAGEVGVGIVPVTTEGVCFFGAIDIDIDTIDHAELYSNVRKHAIPLNVCRSKSGGAHCYVFFKTGINADTCRSLLKSWAEILGYPQAEIFPKQSRSTAQNIGNWINLPYFGGDATTRYCVGPAGAKTLAQFLSEVEYYDPQKAVVVDEDRGSELPPCLRSLQENGIGAGQRNQALLNFAIFYRKSDPKNWEARTTAQNSQYFSPSLDSREVRGIIQSASRNRYQYTCEVSPLRDLCNKPACSKLQFGVGHMPWQEDGGFDDLVVTNCRKLLSDPPKYIIDVNGKDITLSWEEFYSFAKFKSRVGQQLNFVFANRKQASWEQVVRTLLTGRTDIEAPSDAGVMGLVVEKLHEFLTLRERALNREDLLRGLPIQDGPNVLFRASDLKRYLQGFKLDKVEMPDLFAMLKSHGTTHKTVRISGRVVNVWSYPVKMINEQTEDFHVHDFAGDIEL
jgi:hypothetical protein